jgi:U3 small nucleolar RNA-associated protein 11
LETTKGMMGKGAPRRTREQGWVEDVNAPEDRNGEKKRWEGKQWKWKLERKK